MGELLPLFKNNSAVTRSRWRRRAWLRRHKQTMASWLQNLGIQSPSKLVLGAGIIVVLFFSFLAAVLSIGLPNPSSMTIQRSGQSTKVLDRNGIVLYDIYGEQRRTLVSFVDTPDYVKQATLAAEDSNFYIHGGFDVKGLLRGLVLKPLTGRGFQGGSTITQQYAKNIFLTSSRSIFRKMREFILAVEIEKLYTKDKILEMYLNSIPYGNSYYGIETAAQGYYGKSVKELTLAEIAALVALPQAPSYYSPYGGDYEKRLLPRKDWVLDRMLELGYITSKQCQEAKTQKLTFLVKRDSIRAPHFVMYVKELLSEKYGDRALEEGGFTITTTLDWTKQQAAEDIVAAKAQTNKEKYSASNAALVSIDPHTGEILAMVGSANYLDESIGGYVNVATRERQPGSAFKPIVYAAAFLKGYSPATMLMDVHTNFGQGYDPYNYDNRSRGPISIRQALGNSLNVPAVKALAYVGVNEAIELAHKIGITTMTKPDTYGLSLVLGGAEVKLLELTSAYGALAAGGQWTEPLSVLKVVDNRGRVLEQNKPQPLRQIFDAEAAYQVTSILSDDAARVPTFPAGGYLTLPGRPVAAKTGTTQSYRDAWTIGYTPDLVTGVWAGNNDNSEMDKAAGYAVASPIWNAYMRQATANMPVKAFPVPEGIRQVVVDELSGKLPTDATPSTKTEVFSSWNAPTEKDDVHKRVRVVKGTDLLAPSGYSEDQVEYKIYTELHSERPDNSAWENPVLKWAQENGYNNVPTQYYDGSVITGGEINITWPQNGGQIAGNFTINATVKNETVVKEIGLYYDSNLVRKVTQAPWTAEVTGVVLDGRSHQVTARLFKKDGSTVETSISVIAGQAQSSDMVTMANPSTSFFPLDLSAQLTEKGKQLNIQKIEIYLDNKLEESFLPNATGAYTARVESGIKGQHSAYAKLYDKGGATYTSNTITFETR